MNSKKQIFFLVTLSVIIFVVGLGVGAVLKSQSRAEVAKEKTVSNLASKVVSSISVYGQVVKIDGRYLTLSNLGDNLTVNLADNAQIYAFKTNIANKGAKTPVQQQVDFKDIKVGDKVNALIKILADGQPQGLSLVILPSVK